MDDQVQQGGHGAGAFQKRADLGRAVKHQRGLFIGPAVEFIGDDDQLKAQGEQFKKTQYGQYLLQLLED